MSEQLWCDYLEKSIVNRMNIVRMGYDGNAFSLVTKSECKSNLEVVLCITGCNMLHMFRLQIRSGQIDLETILNKTPFLSS